MLYATTSGVGLSPDSVTYLTAGNNIISGHGFTMLRPDGSYVPLTHFAPFYSISVSLSRFFGVSPLIAARWIGAISFGFLIFSIGFVLAGFFKSDPGVSIWFPIFAALFALVSVTLIEIYVMAWSETIFLLIALWCVVLLGKYLDQGSLLAFIFSGLLTGLAIFTRYAGAAVLATAVIGILFLRAMGLGKKLVFCIIYGIISVIPMLFWVIIDLNNTQTTPIREIAFHPLNLGHLQQALTTLSSWLLIPERTSGIIKLGSLLVILMEFLYFVYLRRSMLRHDSEIEIIKPIPSAIKLMLIFQLVYLPFLAISISFLDANTPLDSRILSPIYLFGFILVFYITGQLFSMNRKLSLVTVGVSLIGLILFAGYILDDISFIQKSHNEGIGFNSRIWQQSSILAEFEKLPAPGIIYSNVPEAIYVQTGDIAFGLPKKYDSVLQRPNQEYSHELNDVYDRLKSTNGVLVYFNQVNRANLATENEIANIFPVQVVDQTGDGTIYKIPNDR